MSDYVPHPFLWAGIDDTAFALDEINGAGVNDAVWPDTFDAGQVSNIFITAYPYMPQADLCVRGENRTFQVRQEQQTLCVGAD